MVYDKMRKIELFSIKGMGVIAGACTLIAFLLTIFSLQLIRGNFSQSWYTAAVTNHEVIAITGRLSEMWSRSDIYAGSTSQKMTANQGMLFVNGSLEQTEPDTILAFDGLTGRLLWQFSDKNLTAKVYATSKALYVGFGGTGKLGAYNLHTGEPYWVTRLPKSRSIIRLYANESIVYTESTDRVFHLIEADTGQILHMFTGAATPPTVQAVEGVVQKVVTSTIQFEPEFYGDELFIEKTKFRIQDEVIRAIDRQTNELLWQTKQDRISHIAVTESTIYFLTLDGRLLGLNSREGELLYSVQFVPAPFIRYAPEGYARSYYIAVDEDKGLVYALLGDSRQVFTFKIAD